MTRQDSPSYILEQLRDISSIDQTRVENSAAWKSSLSVEDYVEREHILSMAKLTSSETNRILVFGLKEASKPEIVLSSIELLVRESWKFHKNADGSVAKTSVLSGCIGGVFTNPPYRGKGLATIMVDKMMELARTPEILGEDGIVFLYSEVGDYYTRNGFRSFHVPLVNVPLVQKGHTYEKPENIELIRYHDFCALFKKYNSHVEQEIREKVAADGKDRFAISPTSDYADWFHLRLKYVLSKLHDDSSLDLDVTKDSYEDLVAKFHTIEPFYFGMKSVDPATGEMLGFVVWHYEYDFDSKTQRRKNYLTIIKLHVDTSRASYDEVALQLLSQVKAYFEAEHGVPQLSKFEKIVLWESEVTPYVLRSLREKFGSVDGLENSSLSAICCLDEKDNAKIRDGSMVWEINTKLPWF